MAVFAALEVADAQQPQAALAVRMQLHCTLEQVECAAFDLVIAARHRIIFGPAHHGLGVVGVELQYMVVGIPRRKLPHCGCRWHSLLP